jgi:signal transduction histidine kinase
VLATAVGWVAAGRVLRPVHRITEAARNASGGFGLGPAIVASIAGAHGGTATAGARPGGGLTVTVSLPATGAVPPHDSPDGP